MPYLFKFKLSFPTFLFSALKPEFMVNCVPLKFSHAVKVKHEKINE